MSELFFRIDKLQKKNRGKKIMDAAMKEILRTISEFTVAQSFGKVKSDDIEIFRNNFIKLQEKDKDLYMELKDKFSGYLPSDKKGKTSRIAKRKEHKKPEEIALSTEEETFDEFQPPVMDFDHAPICYSFIEPLKKIGINQEVDKIMRFIKKNKDVSIPQIAKSIGLSESDTFIYCGFLADNRLLAGYPRDGTWYYSSI